MITYKILDDKSILFQKDGVNLVSVKDNIELIELDKAIQQSKFDWCKKFKCQLDNPACK